jgi:hypothetical protein
MSLATSLTAIGDAIDPRMAYWSLTLTSGKEWSERSLVGSNIKGQKGVRKLDWALDIVGTGDIHKVKELRLHCPDGRVATLELAEPGEMRARWPAFQFKTRSMEFMGAGGIDLEFQVIGRVIDKESGRCECFAWDYRPKPGEPNLVAYKSSIYNFGMWRDTCTPISALGVEVQGFRL